MGLKQTKVRKKQIVIVSRVTTFWENTAQTPLQIVETPFFIERGIKLYIKRDDLIHQQVSGNKWRKLKYNLMEAEKLGHHTLVTFGGAYSNHIAAVAAAGQAMDFETIGIIRGDELHEDANATLRFASQCGMKLLFVSREQYRDKDLLAHKHGKDCYVIPEGGSNQLAVKGVAEVMPEIQVQLGKPFQYVCTALGTGGTAAGLSVASEANKVLVFPSLKIKAIEALQMIESHLGRIPTNTEIMTDYHFGGYGKTKDELWQFIEDFEAQTNIPLEQVYTGKMMFGVYDLLHRDYFKEGEVIVALHTGGLQGKPPLG